MEFTDLPEHIFIIIVSLLPLVDAVRLCSLCKQWLDLWVHCRAIELNRSWFTNQATAYCRTMGTRRYFASYVRQMLPRFLGPEIDYFILRLHFESNNSKDQSFLDRVLVFAAEKKVKDLYLDFFTEETLHMFHHCSLRTAESHPSVLNITETLNQVRSLRVLRLTCCGLKDFNFGHEKTFMLLTSLYITGMFVTRDIVANIGFSSPNLEEVSLVDCRMDDYHLPFNATWSKLRRLIVRGGPSLVGLELSAPNIQYLEMAVFVWDLHLGNMKNLAEVVFNLKNRTGHCYWDIDLIDVLDGLRWMKMLTLTHGFLEMAQLPLYRRQLQQTFKPPRYPFSALEELKLEGYIGSHEQVNFVEFFLRYSPRLQKVFMIFPNTTAIVNDAVATLIKWTMTEIKKLERYVPFSRCGNRVSNQ
ncbi:hypothetical protein Syun_010146 [Stephania yunnanensis]|uniref:F-box domain-containing protein n=1 Tax=Stephania yunnanensis TaxID=152371 RepID=A0AAP0PPQ7_9MAGN